MWPQRINDITDSRIEFETGSKSGQGQGFARLQRVVDSIDKINKVVKQIVVRVQGADFWVDYNAKIRKQRQQVQIAYSDFGQAQKYNRRSKQSVIVKKQLGNCESRKTQERDRQWARKMVQRGRAQRIEDRQV